MDCGFWLHFAVNLLTKSENWSKNSEMWILRPCFQWSDLPQVVHDSLSLSEHISYRGLTVPPVSQVFCKDQMCGPVTRLPTLRWNIGLVPYCRYSCFGASSPWLGLEVMAGSLIRASGCLGFLTPRLWNPRSLSILPCPRLGVLSVWGFLPVVDAGVD